MGESIQIILIIALVAWNIVLTLLFLQYYLYYSRINKNGKKELLPKILDEIIANQNKLKGRLDEITQAFVKIEKEGLLHIQKVGLLRFNPFKDTGGDQSFILALVDAQDTGVIISSLHTRSGARWYAKHVINGKGGEYALSAEEEQALKKAKILKAEK